MADLPQKEMLIINIPIFHTQWGVSTVIKERLFRLKPVFLCALSLLSVFSTAAYIYIYRERERGGGDREGECVCVCVLSYI